MDIAELGLVVRSDGVVEATNRLRDLEGQAGKTERAASALKSMFAALAGAFSVAALIGYTSRWTDLNSRVEIATGNLGKGAQVLDRIAVMARRTYSPLEQTAETFLLNATAMKELGLSTSQTLDYVESINNALVVSGAKGERAATVVNAMSKAMALGKLSGQNLNTVLSMGDRVASALAESMGVSTLELRKLGEEGKITSAKLFGITSQMQKLREEADSMPATIQDALMLIGNSVFELIGKVDAATGISQNAANALISVADGIKGAIDPAIAGVTILMDNLPKLSAMAVAFATVMAVQWVAAFIAAGGATGALSAALVVLRGALIRTGIGALVVLLGEMLFYLMQSAEKSGILAKVFEVVGSTASAVFNTIVNTVSALEATFKAVALAIQAAMVGAFSVIYTNYAKMMNAISDGLHALPFSEQMGFDGGHMDEEWAQKNYVRLSIAASEAGKDAARKWAKAFGASVPELVDVNSIVDGLNGKMFEGDSAIKDMMEFLKGQQDTPGKPPPPPPSDAAIKAADAYQKLLAATKDRIEQLGVEASAIGMTDAAAMRLKNSHELLTQAMQTGKKLTTENIQELALLSEQLTDAQLKLQGLQMDLANESPWETMARQIENLNDLLDRGAISFNTYAAEIGKAAETMIGKYATAANGIVGIFESLENSRAKMAQNNIDQMRAEIDAMGLTGEAAIEAQKRLTAAQEAEGRKAFENEKKLAIARAVIAGGEAIVKAYNWGSTLGGPIGGAIAAGLAAAATAAQIAAIASSTYQSKSVATPAAGAVSGAGGMQPGAGMTVIIQGHKGSTVDIEDFADQFAKQIDDGGHKNFITVVKKITKEEAA